MRLFIPLSSPDKITHNQTLSERTHPVFKKLHWEEGLRKIAIELRTLASGIPTELNDKHKKGSNQVIPTSLHPQSSAFEIDYFPFSEGLHDIAQILTTHASRKQDFAQQHWTPPSESIPPTTKSGIARHGETFRCGFRDVIFDLQNISKKAKHELQAHRKLIQSLERRDERCTSNQATKTCKTRGSSLLENRVKRVKPVDSYGYLPRETDQEPGEESQRGIQGRTVRKDCRENNFLHLIDRRLDEFLRSPSHIHSIPNAPIDQEGDMSCWAFALRTLSRQVFHVARRGRAEGWARGLLNEETSKSSIRGWAAQKNGVGTLLDWERRLMQLSNEMWEVSKLICKKQKKAM